MSENRLRNSIVGIKDIHNRIIGTGFFIGNDGTILTTFHSVGNKETGERYQSDYSVCFQEHDLPAKCIFPPEGSTPTIDVAVLQVAGGKLPKDARTVMIGTWDDEIQVPPDRGFDSIGFRSVGGNFEQLSASGKIQREKTRISPYRHSVLQLESQHISHEQIRGGMSGAPVLHTSSARVVGMIMSRAIEVEQRLLGDNEEKTTTIVETIPFAIPMEEVAKVWGPIGRRLNEDELHTELLRILSPESGVFPRYLTGIIAELPAIFNFEPSKDTSDLPKDLLYHLLDRRQLYMFITWAAQRDSFLRDDLLQLQRGVASRKTYLFENREKELHEIVVDDDGSPYFVIDAPAGYGKTQLLYAAERKLNEANWLCIYHSSEGNGSGSGALTTCSSLIADLHDFLGEVEVSGLPTGEAEQGIEWRVQALAEKLVSVKAQFGDRVAGIALFLDDIHFLCTPEQNELSQLVNAFLPGLHNVFSSRNPRVKFKVILAGRYILPTLTNLVRRGGRKIVLRGERSLSPFNYETVRASVAKELSAEEQSEDKKLVSRADSYAANLMYHTGGHPRFMFQALDAHRSTGDLEDIANLPVDVNLAFRSSQFQTKYIDFLQKTSQDVRDVVPAHLVTAFETLSFFRVFNLELLTQIARRDKALGIPEDVFGLSRELTKTYLVSRGLIPGFMQDDVIRRVLNISIREAEPKKFLELSHIALEEYRHYLPSAGSSRHIIIMEMLYHELQLAYHKYNPEKKTLECADENERAQLRARFFQPGGICDEYLRKGLPAAYFPADVLENIKARLAPVISAHTPDWEFIFSLNFYLRRADTYDEEPFVRFMEYIEQLLTKLEHEPDSVNEDGKDVHAEE